jgi:hypothetical protein
MKWLPHCSIIKNPYRNLLSMWKYRSYLPTVTVGAVTVEVTGAATPLPDELVHPFTVCLTV